MTSCHLNTFLFSHGLSSLCLSEEKDELKVSWIYSYMMWYMYVCVGCTVVAGSPPEECIELWNMNVVRLLVIHMFGLGDGWRSTPPPWNLVQSSWKRMPPENRLPMIITLFLLLLILYYYFIYLLYIGCVSCW